MFAVAHSKIFLCFLDGQPLAEVPLVIAVCRPNTAPPSLHVHVHGMVHSLNKLTYTATLSLKLMNRLASSPGSLCVAGEPGIFSHMI